MEKTTRLTLKNEYGEHTVEVYGSDMCIEDMFDELIIPVPLSAGYAQESIDRYLGE